MTRPIVFGAALVLSLSPSLARAQAASPYTEAAKAQFAMIKVNLAKTAEKVPENLYSFKPTPEVRSLGEIVGHVADANYAICAAGAGEKPPQNAPQGGFEKGAHAKADLTKALNDSIAYCDRVLAAMDDKKGAETVRFFGGPTPKLAVLNFNIQHCNEHYGNLVTYMRLKGIVPPSSEPSGR